MTIFGIDPAGKSLAVFMTTGEHISAIKAVTRRIDRHEQLSDLKSALSRLYEIEGQGTTFIEAPVVAGARNIQSTLRIAETVGMVLSLSWPTYVVPVGSWKKAIVGDGHADKLKVRLWLEANRKSYASHCGSDQDLVDAAVINLYGHQVMASCRRGFL